MPWIEPVLQPHTTALAMLAALAFRAGRIRRQNAAVQQAGGWRNPNMVAGYASAIAFEHGAVARHFDGGGG